MEYLGGVSTEYLGCKARSTLAVKHGVLDKDTWAMSTEYLGSGNTEHLSTERLGWEARSTWMGVHGVPGWVCTENLDE